MSEQERFENAEAWLAGKLSGSDLKKFEAELKADKELALEVEILRDMTGLGKDSGRKRLRNTLTEIRAKDESKTVSIFRNNWVWGIAASLVLLFAAFFMFNRSQTEVRPVVDIPEPIIEQPAAPVIEEVYPIEDSSDIDNIVDEKTLKPKPSDNSEPVISPKVNVPEVPNRNEKSQVAERPQIDDLFDDNNSFEPKEGKGYANKKSNFKENSELEKVIKAANLTRIKIELKEFSERVALDGNSAKIYYSGFYKNEDFNDNSDLRFLIFSNNQKAYEKSDFVFQQKVVLDEVGGFNISENMELAPGLYYFLFQDFVTKTYIKGGKFEVI